MASEFPPSQLAGSKICFLGKDCTTHAADGKDDESQKCPLLPPSLQLIDRKGMLVYPGTCYRVCA